MKLQKTIILASQSRDRKRLLSNANIPHTVIVSKYDEKDRPGLSPKELALFHARGKSSSVKIILRNEQNLIPTDQYIIIAADTIVDFKGEILGKAKNETHANQILKKLMGKTHSLTTGVVIYDSESETSIEYIDITEVRFSSLSEEEITDYITFSDEYKWRAGSYSMFDRASVFIESISGSPSNVIGLPMDFVYKELKKFGVNLLKIENKK